MEPDAPGSASWLGIRRQAPRKPSRRACEGARRAHAVRATRPTGAGLPWLTGFDAFREALSAFLEANQFLGLALYVGIEEVGVPFPVPADTLIVLMGYQVSRGEANPLLVLAVTVGSATLGAAIQYWLGRYFGTRLINRFRGVFRLSHERQRRVEVWVRRHQVWTVILLRLVPGFRVILTLVCGVSRVDFRLFVPSGRHLRNHLGLGVHEPGVGAR